MSTIKTKKIKPSDDQIKNWIKASQAFGTGMLTHIRTECEQDGYIMPTDKHLFDLTLEVIKEEKAGQ